MRFLESRKKYFHFGGKPDFGRKFFLGRGSYIFGRDSIYDLFTFGKEPLTTIEGREGVHF